MIFNMCGGGQINDNALMAILEGPSGSYADSFTELDCDITNLNISLSKYTALVSVNLPYCSSVYGAYPFYNCTSLENVCLDSLLSVPALAFGNCVTLSSISLSVASGLISTTTFSNCTNLKYIYSPNLETSNRLPNYILDYACIGNSTAYLPSNVKSLELPKLSVLPSNAAFKNSTLEEINCPTATYVTSSAFSNCSSLRSIHFSIASSVQTYAFYNCVSLDTIDMPNVGSIAAYAFMDCTSLSEVTFPEKSITIQGGAFSGCTSLYSVVLPLQGYCSLVNSNAFNNTPLVRSEYYGTFGSIYVPSEWVASYKTSSVWSVFADRITAIP